MLNDAVTKIDGNHDDEDGAAHKGGKEIRIMDIIIIIDEDCETLSREKAVKQGCQLFLFA